VKDRATTRNDAVACERNTQLTGQVIEELGRTAIFASIDGQPAGVVAVADTAKEDAAQAVAALRDCGSGMSGEFFRD